MGTDPIISICPQCGLVCLNERGLRIHQAVHTGRKHRKWEERYGTQERISVEEFLYRKRQIK